MKQSVPQIRTTNVINTTFIRTVKTDQEKEKLHDTKVIHLQTIFIL